MGDGGRTVRAGVGGSLSWPVVAAGAYPGAREDMSPYPKVIPSYQTPCCNSPSPTLAPLHHCVFKMDRVVQIQALQPTNMFSIYKARVPTQDLLTKGITSLDSVISRVNPSLRT